MIVAQGEPFGSTSIYAQYRVYKLAREHGVTVTLDGQGADELLAGYHGYPGQRVHSLLDQGFWSEAAGFFSSGHTGPAALSHMALRASSMNSPTTLCTRACIESSVVTRCHSG